MTTFVVTGFVNYYKVHRIKSQAVCYAKVRDLELIVVFHDFPEHPCVMLLMLSAL